VALQETSTLGVFFKSDGTKMYIIGASTDSVWSYTLSTAWDISTASWDAPANAYFYVGAQESNPQGVFFKSNGTKMYIVGLTTRTVYEYNLSTAWNISTASYLQNFSVVAQGIGPQGIFFKDDGTKMYIIDNIKDAVLSYDL
jgi:DNA-binding beta-propeller fold protein YncE